MDIKYLCIFLVYIFNILELETDKASQAVLFVCLFVFNGVDSCLYETKVELDMYRGITVWIF